MRYLITIFRCIDFTFTFCFIDGYSVERSWIIELWIDYPLRRAKPINSLGQPNKPCSRNKLTKFKFHDPRYSLKCSLEYQKPIPSLRRKEKYKFQIVWYFHGFLDEENSIFREFVSFHGCMDQLFLVSFNMLIHKYVSVGTECTCIVDFYILIKYWNSIFSISKWWACSFVCIYLECV